MKKVKTYWDEIKNEETSFTGGSYGWEVRLVWEEKWRWDSKKGCSVKSKALELQWPFGYGQKLPKGEKAQTRKDVLRAKKLRKVLAQSSRNRSEYDDLRQRMYRLPEEQVDDILTKGYVGFDLGDYIRHNHYTSREAHALFYNM